LGRFCDDPIYDPWHYVPVLARKLGALRNGAPFKDWVLPAAMERIRRKLAGADGGNRQMVDILTAVITDGLGRQGLRRSLLHCRNRPPQRPQPTSPPFATL